MKTSAVVPTEKSPASVRAEMLRLLFCTVPTGLSAGGRHNGSSWGSKPGGPKRASEAGFIETMFNRWLAEAKPGDQFVYCRGELAYERQFDPYLGLTWLVLADT